MTSEYIEEMDDAAAELEFGIVASILNIPPNALNSNILVFNMDNKKDYKEIKLQAVIADK